MTDSMREAMAAVDLAEDTLRKAQERAREAARAELAAAHEACRLAGVDVRATSGKTGRALTEEGRKRLSEAAKQRWASKSPEARAAWAAAIGRKLVGNQNARV